MVDHFNPAGVGARARIEQRACSAHESVAARTVELEISREAKMGERIPTPGPTLSGRAAWIAREESPYSGLVGNHGGSVDAARRNIRVSDKDCLGLIKRPRPVPMTRHAGYFKEPGRIIGPPVFGFHHTSVTAESQSRSATAPTYAVPSILNSGNSVCVSLDERALIPCASFAGARIGRLNVIRRHRALIIDTPLA